MERMTNIGIISLKYLLKAAPEIEFVFLPLNQLIGNTNPERIKNTGTQVPPAEIILKGELRYHLNQSGGAVKSSSSALKSKKYYEK